MPAHHRVRAWLDDNYPSPAVDQEWLADCSDWITSELGLDPDKHFDDFIHNVETQLLQSNLADSTVHGSGVSPPLVASNPDPRPRPSAVRRPSRQAPRPKQTTGPTPLLVEIKSVTEIAHSAFSLLNTHQTRLDRADLGLARDDNAEQAHDEDEGPIPKFPRGMLRFELSDGFTTFRAIEFRSLPQLELGTTPLGYKMLLKSTPIRNGVAFLEPANVTLKGYKTEDHDANREQVFLSSLRKRLGRPDPPPDEPVAVQQPADPPAQPARQPQPPAVARPPSPPSDFDDMYVDDDVDPDVLREMTIQMDQTIDALENQQTRARAPAPAELMSTSKETHSTNLNVKETPRLDSTIASSSLQTSSTSSTTKTSHYFAPQPSESNPVPDIGLSPRPAPPPNTEPDFDITFDIDDPEPSAAKTLGSTSTKPSSTIPAKRVIQPRNAPPTPDSYDDLSFDMDVDESFLEQVGMIEEDALGAGARGKGKGKAKDAGMQAMASHSRSIAATGNKMPSASILGTTHLIPHPAFGTRVQSNKERATSTSSVSGSTESCMPRSTQSSNRRPPGRDPSLIIISSEDEAEGDRKTTKPLEPAQRRIKKGRKIDPDELTDPNVIDISD